MAGKYLEVEFDPNSGKNPGRFGPLDAIADVGREGVVSDMILGLAKRDDVVGVWLIDEDGEAMPGVAVGDFGRFASTVTIPPGAPPNPFRADL